MYKFLLFLSFLCFGTSKITVVNINVPSTVSIEEKYVILSSEYENNYDYSEDLEKAQWFFNNQLFYEWVSEGKQATKMGRLEKNVDLTYVSKLDSKKICEIKLVNISYSLTGDYSCKFIGTRNQAQSTKHLTVYDKPKLAGIKHFPATVKKGDSITLECLLESPGFPNNVSYVWFRRGYKIHETTEPKLIIERASLDDRTTFSCMATNGPGKSSIQKISIDVLAPPAIIGKTSYASVSYLAKEFSLPCRVECYPLCSIKWYKDEHLLDTKNDPKYEEIIEHLQSDYTTNDFESIKSTLIWKIVNWPNGRLDKKSPLLKYTCVSASGSGPDVKFTTTVAIDSPPENLKLSSSYVNVEEGSFPPAVECTGEGMPHLKYLWKNNVSKIISKGNTLQLGQLSRKQAGYYVCEGFNKHGTQSAKVNFNVQYKPECKILRGFVQRKRALICTADANPKRVSFLWNILYPNFTVDNNDVIVKTESGRWYSYLILNSRSNETMVYQCIAKNSIGFSYPCQIEVSGARRKTGLLSWILQILTLPAYVSLS